MASCARTLPDQDRRITQTTPQVKLSADILWKDYAADRVNADRQYHGKALLVTGVVTSIEKPSAELQYVMFGQTQGKAPGIQANLLVDTANDVMTGVQPGQRITLKCFCEGLSTNVLLKSCVKP